MGKVEDLIGKTLVNITGKVGDDALTFTTDSGEKYKMFHCQDCCEDVYIEDIVGRLSDLIGAPIIKASEDNNVDRPSIEEYPESWTWTFYNFATIKGHVTIRWYGSSNGYYSESVDFERVSPFGGEREDHV